MRAGKFKKALDMGLQATVPLKPLNSRFRFLLGKVICYRKKTSHSYSVLSFLYFSAMILAARSKSRLSAELKALLTMNANSLLLA